MNFKKLQKRLQCISEGCTKTIDECGCDKENDLDECGSSMSMSAPIPPQQNNVSMNISMNGSGVGGIRDLLDILKHINSDKPEDTVALGKKIVIGDTYEDTNLDDSFENEVDPTTYDTSAVLQTGNDLASKGSVASTVTNPGDNRMRGLAEDSLVNRLHSLYNSIS